MDNPGTIYAKFGSIWPSCFRGEDCFNISQSEKRINLGGHVCRPNGLNGETLEDLTAEPLVFFSEESDDNVAIAVEQDIVMDIMP
jgi:hypothetical protein